MVKTLSELYLQTRRALMTKEDADTASFIARQLLSHVTGMSREQILAQQGNYASEKACGDMPLLVNRILSG